MFLLFLKLIYLNHFNIPRSDDDSESAYLADSEEASTDQKSLVQLSFSTLNTFLKHQLCKAPDQTCPNKPGKKRVYNNQNRAAAADEKRRRKEALCKKTSSSRLSRNNEDTWQI